MTIIPLSPRQADMLLDRLDRPDCIVDAIGLPHGLSEADFDALLKDIRKQVRRGRLDLHRIGLPGRLIIADCVNGSTWAAIHDDGFNVSPALAGARRTVLAVHDKLTRAGLKLQPPPLW